MLLAAVVMSLNWKTGTVRVHQHLTGRGHMLSDGDEKTGAEESVNVQEFTTHLPIVEIETGGQKIPGGNVWDEQSKAFVIETGEMGEEEIPVTIKLLDSEDAVNRHGDEPVLETSAMFRVRGNSSRSFAKKNYAVKLVDEKGEENPQEVLGMAAHDKWALHGPFLDKTLIRNYMWMNLSGEIMGYAPNVRFCEVYLDGSYRGLYLMMETIDKGLHRVNITTYEPGASYTDYIVRVDGVIGKERDLDVFSFYTMRLEMTEKGDTELSLVYPSAQKTDESIKSYIQKDFSQFERALYSSDYKDSLKGYKRYIDVDSFVDYYILQEFLCNNDMCFRSTYLYKDRLGKLHMGPVWDYNNILDNYFNQEFDGTQFLYAQRLWYDRLLSDEEFNKKVIRRYKQLRKTLLSEEYLMQYIDETIAYLGESIERNYQVWGYTFEPEKLSLDERLSPVERNPQSYEEAVLQMKQFIRVRGRWLDKNIDALAQFAHESKSKQYMKK